MFFVFFFLLPSEVFGCNGLTYKFACFADVEFDNLHNKVRSPIFFLDKLSIAD